MRLPDPIAKPTLTVEETAAIMGLSRNTTYDAIKRGEIPSLKIGKRVLVPTGPLRRLLAIDPEPMPAAS